MACPSTISTQIFPVTIRGNGELAVSRCTCPEMADSSALPVPVSTNSAAPVKVTVGKNSYAQILKSSALIGTSQIANIAIGIVRTKTMAMLLGPAGFGLFGIYGSIQNLSQNIAGMGINSSGVRQIAAAAASGDRHRIAQSAAVLRQTAIILGVLGASLLFAFSQQVSQLTFASPEHAGSIALLSVGVFFTLVSGGQGALIQGMRRIGDLAKMNVIGTTLGLCSAVPLVYFFRERGVVPSLVVVASMGILISWWYSSKIEIEPAAVTFSQVRKEASALLKLGSAFMASSLMTLGTAYAVRILIVRNIGMEATGLYQSAWTLGGLYVGFILQAMGADFYPRLTASIARSDECNRLVNEQTLIGVLLAGPGVVATLTFAPLVITLFYSAKFSAAVVLLRWISLGVMLQVITWPMGFVIVAKGRPALFFLTELIWTLGARALSWFFITVFGLKGSGIAFFAAYVFHLALVYPLVRWLTGFDWSFDTLRNICMFALLIGSVFGSFYIIPFFWAALIGSVLALGSGVYSLCVLVLLLPLEQLPMSIRRYAAVLHNLEHRRRRAVQA